jgi:hypothetical protein
MRHWPSTQQAPCLEAITRKPRIDLSEAPIRNEFRKASNEVDAASRDEQRANRPGSVDTADQEHERKREIRDWPSQQLQHMAGTGELVLREMAHPGESVHRNHHAQAPDPQFVSTPWRPDADRHRGGSLREGQSCMPKLVNDDGSEDQRPRRRNANDDREEDHENQIGTSPQLLDSKISRPSAPQTGEGASFATIRKGALRAALLTDRRHRSAPRPRWS